MKQKKNIEKVVSNIYDKLLIEKKNNSQKHFVTSDELLNIARIEDIGKNKKLVVLLADVDVIFSNEKILVDGYIKDKNLRSLC